MYIHVIFNPNQEKNLLGYKVVDYSNNLNGVCCLNLRTTVQMLKLARLEIANRMLKALKNFKMNQALLRNLGAVEQKVGNSSLLLTSSR